VIIRAAWGNDEGGRREKEVSAATKESTPSAEPLARSAAVAVPGLSEQRLAGLVEEQADFVWRSLRGMGVSPSVADDATQQVFIVMSQKLEQVEPGRERAFLYGVAMNVAAHARRARARSREIAEAATGEDMREAADTAPNPETQLADAQARALLDRVLDALSEELRQVFVLFELEELTMIDIAQLLSIPPGTVASRLRRARAEFHAAASRVRAGAGASASASRAAPTGGRP
jgi:RNA polymerase sigma-70 factor, ECF subfamily